ncbi:MAG TPA: FecR family protein [Polyangiaceae bacterium]|nr:FecR family protein [Polyangiaceae bacterium]
MSSAKRKIAIEPLSRAAWDRVEAKLLASLDQGEHLVPAPVEEGTGKRWRLRAGVAATALAAAAATLLFLKRDPGEPPRAGGEPVVASATAPLPEPAGGAQAFLADGSRIETSTAPVQSTIGDSMLEIADHSSLRVAGDDAHGWLVSLDAGRVECRVAPRRGRPPFAVQAGDTRVTVVGTRFSVERREQGARVVVQEGIVRVQSGEQSVLLSPGESWPAESNVPASSSERAPEPAPHHARKSAAGAHSGQSASAEQRLFERAARLEATDPQAALRIYRELDRHGAWSANALYARGRLGLASGQPSGKRDLELYLKRYPNGPNAEDVRALLRSAGGQR